ncbi:hypothetical protein [Methanobrevibacter sp.]|uniref:hypothetical protein n=1 Tax=Methanobrevibacter sp. TaxID=66852 RepID=UPI00388EF812
MSNLNTFPHINADDLNLDWLLLQYATFNERIAEIMAHFDEVAAAMADQNEQYKNQMLALYNNYKNYVDAKVASMQNQVDSVKDAVEQINQKTDEYVYNYLEENITEILQDNPVIETRYENKGGIAAGATTLIELDQNVVYDIMLNNWDLGTIKILASNNDWNYVALPMITENDASHISGVTTAIVPGGSIGDTFVKEISYTQVPVSEAVSYVTVSINNRVMSITNNSQQTITLYMKRA